ncbi:hypothetical protein ACHAXT_008500 [Thalassiosira profunda]
MASPRRGLEPTGLRGSDTRADQPSRDGDGVDQPPPQSPQPAPQRSEGGESIDEQWEAAAALAQAAGGENSLDGAPPAHAGQHPGHRPTEENTTEDDEAQTPPSQAGEANGLEGIDGDEAEEAINGESGGSEKADGTDGFGREGKTHLGEEKIMGEEDDGEVVLDDDEEGEETAQLDEEDEVTDDLQGAADGAFPLEQDLSKLQIQDPSAVPLSEGQNNALVPHGIVPARTPSPQLQPEGNETALTVLPPNELSATTADAAEAADTFADMMGELRGEGPPGLVVDDSGVVRRTGTVGGHPGMDYPGGGGAAAPHPHHRHPGMAPRSPPRGGSGGGRDGDPRGRDPLPNEEDEGSVSEDEEEGEGEDSSEISASDEDGSWIAWFCHLRGNEFFCEVDEDYIQDDFNLTGLNGLVPYYDYALDMVLDVEMPMEDSLTEEQQEIVESAAEMLYGLIHARYIVTNRGMHAMYEKYRSASFGRCPRVFCQGQPVLPVGLSDLPRNYTVNVFCPRCRGLFFPKSTRQANVDGAYFGTTFPHLYLMTHPEMIPARPAQQYAPRVYGFRINRSSLYYRNQEEGHQHAQGQRDDENRRSRRASRSRQGGGGGMIRR